jgi:protein-S-isoprenylcysteine O-methyltransferase Ste14
MIEITERQPVELVAPARGARPLFRRAYRARGALVTPAIIAAAVAAWRAHPRGLDLAMGTAAFLIGWLGRMWAQRHLGYRIRRRMRLTTCGPYRWVRNPVYVANTLVVTGTTLMAGSHLLAAGAALLCAAVYGLTVRYEEARLARWYGRRYLAYCSVTPRWLPAPSASPSAARCGCARSWGDVVIAEWHVPLIVVPVLLPLVVR